MSDSDIKARALGACCESCYLRERREGAPVLPEINPGALCLAVGEAPGEREVEEGRPFVGPSGFEAERAFESAGVPRKRVSWANALCCRPKGNDLDRLLYDLKRENKQRIANKIEPIPLPQECCRPVMLSALRQYENIVTLGKVGYQSVTGSDHSIMAIRGFPIRGMLDDQGMFWTGFDESACNKKLMPTIHPAFVLRARRWIKTFRIDIARAVRWFTGQMRWVEPSITYNPSPSDLEAFLLRGKHSFVVYDVETAPTLPAKEAHFDPLLDKLRCIGFGTSMTTMVVGFLSVDGVTKPYTESELSEITEIIRRFMLDPSIIKVGHNVNYYDRMVIEHHLGVTPSPTVDTIALHKVADAELPHSLGFVGSMLTDVATAWKADHTATEATTDQDLYRYNALDVTVNARIVEPLWASVQAIQGDNCVRVLHKVQAACVGMHRNGMFVDEAARRIWDAELRAKAIFHKKKLVDAVGDHNFNPASYDQVKKTLFDRWGLIPVNYTETGEPSTDDETIRTLILRKGLSDQQSIFLDSMRWFRRWTKFRGTYVRKLVSVNTLIDRDDLAEDTEIDASEKNVRSKKKAKGQVRYGIVLPDGRMHADWNAHGTVGWRLSSSHPNCQNFPRRLRNMIIPAPGNVFVGADMDQLELRFVAALADARRYLEVFNSGGDPHSLSAELIFGDTFRNAEGETRKRIRDFSKTFTYAVIYGASDETVKETIASTEDKEGKLVYADITLRDTRNRKRAWLDGSPEIEKWWQSEIELYQKQLYLAEPVLGLRRNFLDGEDRNEILNLRAQSGGKAVVHLAMIELLEGELPFQKWGPGTGLVHDGHDSLVFEVPEAEAERVKMIVESAMCRSVPGLNVRFTASAKIARSWDKA